MLNKYSGENGCWYFVLLTFYEEIQRRLLTPPWWWKMAASVHQTKSVSVIWNAYLMLSHVINRDTFTNIRTQTEDTNSLSWIRCSSSGPITMTTNVLKIFLVEGGAYSTTTTTKRGEWFCWDHFQSDSINGRNTDNPFTEPYIRFCSTK